MKFKDLKDHSVFVIPITPDIGKTKDEVNLKGYAHYIKSGNTGIRYSNKEKMIINNHNLSIETKYSLEIPENEEVILVEE